MRGSLLGGHNQKNEIVERKFFFDHPFTLRQRIKILHIFDFFSFSKFSSKILFFQSREIFLFLFMQLWVALRKIGFLASLIHSALAGLQKIAIIRKSQRRVYHLQ